MEGSRASGLISLDSAVPGKDVNESSQPFFPPWEDSPPGQATGICGQEGTLVIKF